MEQILMTLTPIERAKIITSVAVIAVRKYRLYPNVNEAIEDLTNESYIVLEDYKELSGELFYRHLCRYVNRNKYQEKKTLKCSEISSDIASKSKSVERQFEDLEIRELISEFKNSLPEKKQIIFNNLLDKTFPITVKLSQQRVNQIKTELKRDFRSFLYKKNYRL